jgi:hypothetical protein
MNGWLMTGCILVLGAALVHALTGEKVILPRLFRRPAEGQDRRAADDPAMRAAVRLAWHSLTVALVGDAALLAMASLDANAFGNAWLGATRVLAVVMLALAVLSLALARGRNVGWMWYAAAAATTWLGA